MAKFLKLTDLNGGTLYWLPGPGTRLSTTMTTGADKKPVELTVIRHADGSIDRVTEKVDDIIRLVEKA